MKCLKCGAETRVLYTRAGKLRRRVCERGHRFSTEEIASEELGPLRALSIRLARLRQIINESTP